MHYGSIPKDYLGSWIFSLNTLPEKLRRSQLKKATDSYLHCFNHLAGAFAIGINVAHVEMMIAPLSGDTRLR